MLDAVGLRRALRLPASSYAAFAADVRQIDRELTALVAELGIIADRSPADLSLLRNLRDEAQAIETRANALPGALARTAVLLRLRPGQRAAGDQLASSAQSVRLVGSLAQAARQLVEALIAVTERRSNQAHRFALVGAPPRELWSALVVVLSLNPPQPGADGGAVRDALDEADKAFSYWRSIESEVTLEVPVQRMLETLHAIARS